MKGEKHCIPVTMVGINSHNDTTENGSTLESRHDEDTRSKKQLYTPTMIVARLQ